MSPANTNVGFILGNCKPVLDVAVIEPMIATKAMLRNEIILPAN